MNAYRIVLIRIIIKNLARIIFYIVKNAMNNVYHVRIKAKNAQAVSREIIYIISNVKNSALSELMYQKITICV